MTKKTQRHIKILEEHDVHFEYTDKKLWVVYYLNTGLEIEQFEADVTDFTTDELLDFIEKNCP